MTRVVAAFRRLTPFFESTSDQTLAKAKSARTRAALCGHVTITALSEITGVDPKSETVCNVTLCRGREMQSAEEEQKRPVYAGVPAIRRGANESISQHLGLGGGIGCAPGATVRMAATFGSAVEPDSGGGELHPWG